MLAQTFDLSDKDFLRFRELIYDETGIALSERKKRLLVARLTKRLRALGLQSFGEYYDYLINNPAGKDEFEHFINRITTNKTDFFRERHHFDFLHDELLPDIIREGERSGQRRLRIWSAGCSTGEEPYSIAMTVADTFARARGWDIRILATDLDTNVLETASAGIYPSQTVAPINRDYLSRYFVRNGTGYEVCPEIKHQVVFRKLNLMQPAFPMKRPFDLIFCRNVIIYFDMETKTRLMNKFHEQLKPGGYMFIGHSESLMNMKTSFSYVKNTIYRKV